MKTWHRYLDFYLEYDNEVGFTGWTKKEGSDLEWHEKTGHYRMPTSLTVIVRAPKEWGSIA